MVRKKRDNPTNTTPHRSLLLIPSHQLNGPTMVVLQEPLELIMSTDKHTHTNTHTTVAISSSLVIMRIARRWQLFPISFSQRLLSPFPIIFWIFWIISMTWNGIQAIIIIIIIPFNSIIRNSSEHIRATCSLSALGSPLSVTISSRSTPCWPWSWTRQRGDHSDRPVICLSESFPHYFPYFINSFAT